MRKIITYLSLILVVFGIVGFSFNLLIGSGVVSINMELPLYNIQGVVEKNNKIFLGLGFYNRLQVYDLNGAYLGYKKTNNYSNDFDFTIDENDNPHVERSYVRAYVKYSYLDSNNIGFKEGYLPRRITCYSRINKNYIRIEQSSFYSLWSGPIIPWCIGAFGMIVFLFTNIYKIIGVVSLKEEKQTKIKILIKEIFK